MFGKLLGAALSAPVRMVNIPVKITQKALEAVDPLSQYQAPRKNTLDKVADTISDSCEEALNDDE